MVNYLITRDIAQHRADWNVLYAAYATFYKVEQTQEMRDRTWGWIMEGRINCLMALNEEGRPIGLAQISSSIQVSAAAALSMRFSRRLRHWRASRTGP